MILFFFEKALNVRRAEVAPVSLLFLYLFLALGGFIMGQSVGDALFLSAFPAHLPQVIIATALVVGMFTSVYIRLTRWIRLEWLMTSALVFFSASLGVFWMLARIGHLWAYPLVYVWVFMAGAVAPAMGWTLANFALTTREARRVFGFIGAGAVLGAPCAGWLTADLIRRHPSHPEDLLLIVAATLLLNAMLVQVIFRRGRLRSSSLRGLPLQTRDTPSNLTEMWKLIRAARYLSLITALVAIGCICTTIISYQFRMITYGHFAGDRAAMAVFFGTFNAYMGLASFGLQMLLTGRLLRTVGIHSTLLILPVVFIGGSLAVFAAPILITACILKGSHSLLRYSLDKSSTELLYLPVAPSEVKSQLKSFIDGFVYRAADGVAGVSLLIFTVTLKFTPGQISLINIVFLSAWLAIALAVRREYLQVLRQAIERRSLDPERTAAAVLDSTTIEVLAGALERAGEQQVLYGLTLFEVGRHAGWHPMLRRLLDHPEPSVRQAALRLLCDAGDRNIQAKVEKLLGDPSLEVRTEALHYLAVFGGSDPLRLLRYKVSVPHYALQGALVAYLSRTQDSGCHVAAQLITQTMLAQEGVDRSRTLQEVARALGAIPAPSNLHAELFPLFRDRDLAVVEQALLSAGKTGAPEFLPTIVRKLQFPRLLGAARAALLQYGDRAVAALQDDLANEGAAMAVRRQIPHVLAMMDSPQAEEALARNLFQTDPSLRLNILRALNRLQRRSGIPVPARPECLDLFESELMGFYRSFQILSQLDSAPQVFSRGAMPSALVVRALLERMRAELERIFLTLELLYPSDDISNSFAGLVSGRPHLQSNALEVLEHVLPQVIFSRLVFAIDADVSSADRLAVARRICHTTVQDRADALRILLHTGDSWLRVCAVHAAGEFGVTALMPDFQRLRGERDPLLRETLEWAESRLTPLAAT